MKRFNLLLLLCFCAFLMGCPKDSEPAPNTRVPLSSDIFIRFDNLDFDGPITCDKSVTYKNIKFSAVAATKDEVPDKQRCYINGNGVYFIGSGGALVIDVSYYSKIKTIGISSRHACSGSPDPIILFFYDLNSKLIERVVFPGTADNYISKTRYYTFNFENLKEVRFVSKCEALISGVSLLK